MKPYYQDKYTTLYNADCRDVLPLLEGQYFGWTDPPYNVGKDYGIWCVRLLVSLDHNAAMRLADFGKAMHQYVSDNGEFVGGGCYESMRVSLQKQKFYWHKDAWNLHQSHQQLSLF